MAAEENARAYAKADKHYAFFCAIDIYKEITHKNLASKVKCSESSLSQFVGRIEHKGYISFRKSGRTKYYYLTARGKKLFAMMKLFEDDMAKAFAVYYILLDAKIPYFELFDGIQMDEEEYGQIIQKIRGSIQEARFVLSTEHEQWPEMTYLLLQVMNKLEDDRDKAVLLSHIFQFREREAGKDDR